MDITPHVNLLKSLRGERVNYVQLVGEGVDNALDAGATSVAISIDDGRVEFVDNGAGIARERISALFSLGKHGAQPTTALGRFGVGITSQAVNAGDLFEVASISADGKFVAMADWRSILRKGQWEVDDPHWLPVVVGSPTGTAITISELRKAAPLSLEKISADIALNFHPVLLAGHVITLNSSRVEPLAEPRMTDVIDRHLSLSNGRGAHVRAGLLIEQSALNMVHVAYRHRVIMPRTRLGCGVNGGLSKMFARVQITGPWHLAKFKDDLTDEDEREELEAAVADVLQPILEKCNSASMTARIKEITSRINDRIPDELRPSRPRKRGKATEGGKDKRSGSGLVSEDKSDEASGPARAPRKPKDQLIINLDGHNSEQGVGKFIAGRPHCVNLSPDNPLVSRLCAGRDQDVNVEALTALALSIFIAERGLLPLEPFGVELGDLLSMQNGGAEVMTA